MGQEPKQVADSHVSGQSNKPLSKPPHALKWKEVAEELQADIDDGLNASEASKRLEEFGRNELGDGKKVNPGKILVRQIANAMTLVLIIAMIVSFAIQSWIEGGVVAGVIFINITVGFFQEFQAEKTMDSLRSLSSPTAQAVRNGQSNSIATVEIVPGDLVELKTGDTIPADVRLIDAVNFETDEALLTGESLPVRKAHNDVFDTETGPGDRLNVAYSSSTVTKGRASGIVFATGMHTEIGTIAAALRKKDSRVRPVKRNEDGKAKPYRYVQAALLTMGDAVGHFLGVNVGTPLQKKLSRLACLLFIIAVICAVIVLAANDFRNQREVIIYAVATGLSMIPASLVVVLTITMAAGTNRMVERHVIVRNLRSLEALGGVTDICSDKTGTLTQGKMVAKKAWIPAEGTYTIEESDEAFNPTKGAISFSEKEPQHIEPQEKDKQSSYAELLQNSEALKDYLRVASLANLATVHQTDSGTWNARGDPTEIAIQVFASRFQWNRRASVGGDNPAMKLLVEFPFDSDVKKMSVIYKDLHTDKMYAFTKGAVERVIASCTTYNNKKGDSVEITEEYRDEVLQNMEALAKHGLRVLALASRDYNESYVEGKEIDRSKVENDLVFRGLVGLYDPPRPESAPSVRRCHEAGIEVHMLTGDHPGTARAIAGQVGILPRNMSDISKDVADSMVMTASQFDALTDDQIDNLPVLPLVIARCAPNTKVRMIEALHRRNKFCAMTGDGVNDSPSLKRADVGIAMGQAGSDVAKDASDIILTDDNFASILAAVEEGRRTFDNIQRFVLHLLAQNISQACVLLIGLVFKDDENLSVFPISPIEILWVIMITSGIPDMGLGFQEKAPDVLSRPPQNLKRGIFTIELLVDMVVYGIWIAALCLTAFVLVLYPWGGGQIGIRCNESIGDGCGTIFRARATCFACLTWFSLFLAWEVVDMRRSFFRMTPNSTHYFTNWMRVVWRNQFLFWAIVAGFALIFPILYIPVISGQVFRHTGISWEWGIVFVASALFFLGIEAWKWCKRVYFRRQKAQKAQKAGRSGSVDLEAKVFERYLTQSSMGDEKSKA
ncbi:Sodium transport ATPase 5 [Fulvia fulva]|uniref:P-type Na(+) transporter n=1 Tax=Passalora fulva TaxID=5499 RepID=A0A9Q8P2K0_PASFU|nr:Sodium transport ATPase 5 [Fulvia fulva]KAK4635352.1 Sodium transport ATPase 5 [Fulvia fulva]KAK4638500.1 Sodium transport ATPase 5 [Fulvia fulva]UJO11025.1 Sodium transport ATPase 5 [Fulvia fulva]WPV10405.1 Sodium transport ATPase 5 [Fulvia fulva]WPV24505.1 Sodium transport ATPase 5 [Fulvia fulva]